MPAIMQVPIVLLACLLFFPCTALNYSKMCRKVYEMRLQLLGKSHPHTLSSMSNLALGLGDMGKDDESYACFMQMLDIQKQVTLDPCQCLHLHNGYYHTFWQNAKLI